MSDGSGEKIKKFVFKTKNSRIGETTGESLEVAIPEVNETRPLLWKVEADNKPKKYNQEKGISFLLENYLFPV
jgi:hypothetical protein